MKDEPKVGGPKPVDDELPANLMLSSESKLLLTLSRLAAAAAAAIAEGGMLLIEGD